MRLKFTLSPPAEPSSCLPKRISGSETGPFLVGALRRVRLEDLVVTEELRGTCAAANAGCAARLPVRPEWKNIKKSSVSFC